MERTFSIIKPDAVNRGITNEILMRIFAAGFKVVAMKKLWITQDQAKGFYAVHRGKPFFEGLTEFMTIGPSYLLVLEKENAIQDLRALMGCTNYQEAAPGTIRRLFATSLRHNCIHGSDSPESAAFEIGYWFAGYELAAASGEAGEAD